MNKSKYFQKVAGKRSFPVDQVLKPMMVFSDWFQLSGKTNHLFPEVYIVLKLLRRATLG